MKDGKGEVVEKNKRARKDNNEKAKSRGEGKNRRVREKDKKVRMWGSKGEERREER